MTKPAQLEREIAAAIKERADKVAARPAVFSHMGASLSVAKGDRLDNFGQVWRVLSVSKKLVTMARETPDPLDRFEKVLLVDQRNFHPSHLAHMRKI